MRVAVRAVEDPEISAAGGIPDVLELGVPLLGDHARQLVLEAFALVVGGGHVVGVGADAQQAGLERARALGAGRAGGHERGEPQQRPRTTVI